MKASIFNMTMNDQILRQESEQTRKHDAKKAHKRAEDDAVQLEVTQQVAKSNKKRKNQRTLITKRRKVAQALNKKNVNTSKLAKNRETMKSDLNRLRAKQSKENQASAKSEKSNLPKDAFENLKPAAQHLVRQFGYRIMDRHLKFFDSEIEDTDFIPNEEDLPEEFQTNTKEASETHGAKDANKTHKPKKTKKTSSNETKAHVKKLSPKEKKAYLTKILSGNGKEILETLINPKYLVGCTLTDEEILALRKKVSKKASLIRKASMLALPSAVNSVKRSGFGSELGSWGNQFPDPDSSGNPNSAIFEAMAESLELTGLLEKLGIKSNLTESKVQADTATEEVAESKTQAEKNEKALHKNLHRSTCQKIIKIFSYIAAFILIAIGQPEAGLLMLAAASGLLQMLIAKLAEAMGMSQLGVKALIMAITIAIAIISADPEIMGEEAISALEAFGNTMLVAGSIGFVQDFIGFCATGQSDESKFPSWVSWAALGINIAVMLPDLVVGGYQIFSRAAAKAASKATDAASEAAASAEAAAAAAKAASDAAEEAGVAGVRGASSAGDAENVVEDAATTVERAAGGAVGQALEEGADAVATTSRSARSTTRPVEAVNGDAATVAATAAEDGAAPLETVSSNGKVSKSETLTSGAAERATVSGASEENEAEAVEEALDGDDAQNAVAALSGSTSAKGSETYAAAEKDVSETLKEAKEGDPFKAKLRKMQEALEKASQELDRLSALEERAASASEETAGEAAGQLKKAQEEVERLKTEVARLTEKVTSQEKAIANFTRQFEDLKAIHEVKLNELATLEQDAAANADAIAQLKGEIAEVEQKMSTLSEQVKALESTQRALSDAEDKLAKAQERVAECQKRLNTDAGKTSNSKWAKMKAYLRTNFGKLGKVLLMTDQVGQAYAEYKLGEIDMDIATLLAEIAEASGNYELLNSLYDIFGTLQADTRQRNEQYSKDLHDEVKLVGDIINAERRASNALMSA